MVRGVVKETPDVEPPLEDWELVPDTPEDVADVELAPELELKALGLDPDPPGDVPDKLDVELAPTEPVVTATVELDPDGDDPE